MKTGGNSASIVIACFTQQRWKHLCAAVASALNQSVPPDEVVVVVDYNEELRRLCEAQWPLIRVVENTLDVGASGARNSGASKVESPIIAFLDDDAVADHRWLELLLERFDDPSVVGVGGGVTGAWEVEKPKWFPDEFAWVVGATFTGMPQVVAEVRNVWAENMAVRRDRFVEVGGFRLKFGKVGSHSSPEDTDLCIRVAANGGRWLFVPGARVTHHVPAQRSNFRYFLKRSFHEGEGKAALRALSADDTLDLERRYTTYVLPRAFMRGIGDALRQRRLPPALRSGAIAVGLISAGLGYARERLTTVS
jgi:GT2 family glycosyltransferase